MDKKILMALGAVFTAGALVAAPGIANGGTPRGGNAPSHASAPRAYASAPHIGKPTAARVHGTASAHSHAAMPKAHRPAARPHASVPKHHAPPPPKHRHAAPRFLHPRGRHIGARHVVIVPPTVLVNEYYWTEEVLIDGYYYVLYCYPDGTKRFADGTIYCYF